MSLPNAMDVRNLGRLILIPYAFGYFLVLFYGLNLLFCTILFLCCESRTKLLRFVVLNSINIMTKEGAAWCPLIHNCARRLWSHNWISNSAVLSLSQFFPIDMYSERILGACFRRKTRRWTYILVSKHPQLRPTDAHSSFTCSACSLKFGPKACFNWSSRSMVLAHNRF